MLRSFFANTLYVQVKKNQFRVRNLETNRSAVFDADPPFTTARLLIGEFVAAESLLKRALRETSGKGFFSVAPRVVIHPLEMTEGGLSEIEKRVMQEVAIGAGASKVVVWTGPELADHAVREKLEN
jgi:rod shape-determining protein MreB and related proteins